ncbi:MAG: hypothetical protein IPK66_08845 [Rhodospirillales bacterium]|nr:hypothetical protein [Rhodospirillales bacterium]
MVRSAGVASCLPNAKARVTISTLGEVETMTVAATGLPKNVGFDFFIIQQANAPFGLSWYQGDMESDSQGRAVGVFVGRFSRETFIVAPGSTAAPVVDGEDASTNPATEPVHTFHLGMWFNSPADAAAAGCPNIVTPFNGEHNAGIQVLNTSNFAVKGPLFNLVQ